MPVIALTGGIGSGKSTISAHLAALGAHIIDADVLARRAVEPGSPGLRAIQERFGDSVITSDGALDRAALAGIAFTDEQSRLALNAIVHPEVRRLYEMEVADLRATDPDAIIVYDVPLLAENPSRQFDGVIVVETDRAIRIDRLVQSRGMSVEEAERRIAAQATDEQRRAIADVVIDNSGTRERTLAQVDRVWHALERGDSLRALDPRDG